MQGLYPGRGVRLLRSKYPGRLKPQRGVSLLIGRTVTAYLLVALLAVTLTGGVTASSSTVTVSTTTPPPGPTPPPCPPFIVKSRATLFVPLEREPYISIEAFMLLSADCRVTASALILANSSGVWGRLSIENPEGYEVMLDSEWPLHVRLRVIDGVEEFIFILSSPSGGPVTFTDREYTATVVLDRYLDLSNADAYREAVVEIEMEATIEVSQVRAAGSVGLEVVEEMCTIVVTMDVGSKPGAALSLPLGAGSLLLTVDSPAVYAGRVVFEAVNTPSGEPVITFNYKGRGVAGLVRAVEDTLAWAMKDGLIEGFGPGDLEQVTSLLGEKLRCRGYTEYTIYWDGEGWALLEKELLPPAATPTPRYVTVTPTAKTTEVMEAEALETGPGTTTLYEEPGTTSPSPRAATIAKEPQPEGAQLTRVTETPAELGERLGWARTMTALIAGISVAAASWLVSRLLLK